MANCGLFWIANSVMSAVMGASNRSIQEKAAQRNEDFQRELEDARNLTQDEMEAEKIAFKRRMMKVSRQYRQAESVQLFDQQLKGIELQSYIERYWPLAPQMPNIILSEIEQSRHASAALPLNVVLLHAPLLPPRQTLAGEVANGKDIEVYKELEQQLAADLALLGDIKLRRDCCTKADFVGGNANLMNIHFLMGGLPTLVISPKYDKQGLMTFHAAVWEAQAPRLLIRPLFSISYEPLIAERETDYFTEAIEKIKVALITIIGSARDSYMLLTQGKAPMLDRLLDNRMRRIIQMDEVMSRFVHAEYANIVQGLDVKKTPKLLEAYSEADVDYMKQQAQRVCETFN